MSKHPLFVDMTGETPRGFRVLARAHNDLSGNARWRCRHECGAEIVMLGTVLRQTTPPRHCPACMPERYKKNSRRSPHLCGCMPQRPCPSARALFREGRTAALRAHLARTLKEDLVA